MSGVPWVRLESGIATHDKTLGLVEARKWQAAAVYMYSLAWCGGQGTDGYIPRSALPFIHATPKIADQLVSAGLWETAPTGGWIIRNWDLRQGTAHDADVALQAKRLGGRRGNCVRWHGPECGCWRDDRGSP